jgi:RND family efflux transporter MFP subunit
MRSFRTTISVLAILISASYLPAASAADGPSLTFSTTLLVENDVVVKSRLTGVIAKIYVERGAIVKQGDPLASLQNDDLAMEVQKAEVTQKQSEAEFHRSKSLYDQKLLSDSVFDEKRLAYEKANAEYELAKINYEKSIIKAPFGGVVVERYGKIGQRVVEDDDVPLFRITAMEPLQARIFVTEEQLPLIAVGDRADFSPAVWPDRHFAGRIKWISSAIDAASGTSSVLIELSGNQGRGLLKPGTSGKLTLWGRSAKSQTTK